ISTGERSASAPNSSWRSSSSTVLPTAIASALRAWSPISRPSSPKKPCRPSRRGTRSSPNTSSITPWTTTYIVVPRSPRRNSVSPGATRRGRPTCSNSAYSSAVSTAGESPDNSVAPTSTTLMSCKNGRIAASRPRSVGVGRRLNDVTIPAAPGCVPALDAVDVGGHVVAEHEQRADPDHLARIVEVRRQHRHAGALGDLPEPRLPAIDVLARAFGGEPEPVAFRIPDQRGGLLGDAGRRVAVHRDDPEPAHEHAERPPEQLVLAEDADVQAQRELGRQAPDAVPVGRMRRADQHQLRKVGEGALHAPSTQAQHGAPEPAADAAAAHPGCAGRQWQH